MWFYAKLTFIKKYPHKFLFIAFLGVHIPLIGLITYCATKSSNNYSGGEVILTALVLTLIGSALTLYFLNRLLKPLQISKKGLEVYTKEGVLPSLPTHYTDEAGVLMAQIQHTLEKLDKIIEEKKDILALASHDLRSPATQVQGLVQLLRSDTDPVAIEQYHTMIDDLCSKQVNLLENLITLLRTNESMITSDSMEKTYIKELLETCLIMNRVLLNTKNVSIKLNLPEEEVFIPAEKVLLTQAIQNLLNNAIKYSEKGDTITITVTPMSQFVKLEIKDNGLGFPPESAELLFDKFTMERKKGTFKESTTGLGLYLTKKIIAQHNGDIEAYSEGANKGARFTITLPVV